jgi:hypothetical protein
VIGLPGLHGLDDLLGGFLCASHVQEVPDVGARAIQNLHFVVSSLGLLMAGDLPRRPRRLRRRTAGTWSTAVGAMSPWPTSMTRNLCPSRRMSARSIATLGRTPRTCILSSPRSLATSSTASTSISSAIRARLNSIASDLARKIGKPRAGLWRLLHRSRAPRGEPDSPVTPAAQEALSEQVDAAIDAPNDINGDQSAELAGKTTGNFISELLRGAYAQIRKSGAAIRDGLYREAGAHAFRYFVDGDRWPEISSFVVHNADALRAFVKGGFQNPK